MSMVSVTGVRDRERSVTCMVSHRSLEVWRMAHTLAKGVHRLRVRLPGAEQRGLGDQLWRAALATPCNIVEGYARQSARQLAYHVNVAIGSLAETSYLLELIGELGLARAEDLRPLLDIAAALQPRLSAFHRAVLDGRSRHGVAERKHTAQSRTSTAG